MIMLNRFVVVVNELLIEMLCPTSRCQISTQSVGRTRCPYGVQGLVCFSEDLNGINILVVDVKKNKFIHGADFFLSIDKIYRKLASNPVGYEISYSTYQPMVKIHHIHPLRANTDDSICEAMVISSVHVP